jgi:hypothetical protein
MNNKPVAWINLDRFKDEALYLADCVSENRVDNMGITTPLYTHPAKTLTNSEIDNLIAEVAEKPNDEDLYDFAQAILKKVQDEQ